MRDPECIFCSIIAGELPSKVVWENSEFIAIENKFPAAPVHILIIPKKHIEKKEVREKNNEEFWGKMMMAVFEVVRLLELDKKGYRLTNNGAGYNHLEHEHIHVESGLSQEEL